VTKNKPQLYTGIDLPGNSGMIKASVFHINIPVLQKRYSCIG